MNRCTYDEVALAGGLVLFHVDDSSDQLRFCDVACLAAWAGAHPARKAPPAPIPEGAEPYQLNGYTLYARDVALSLENARRVERIYFFAKNTPKTGSPVPLPHGYEVRTTLKTGLPILRRKERG